MRSLDSDGPDPLVADANRIMADIDRRDFRAYEARLARSQFYASREPSVQQLLDDIPRL